MDLMNNCDSGGQNTNCQHVNTIHTCFLKTSQVPALLQKDECLCVCAGGSVFHLNSGVRAGRHDHLSVCWCLRFWYQGKAPFMMLLHQYDTH